LVKQRMWLCEWPRTIPSVLSELGTVVASTLHSHGLVFFFFLNRHGLVYSMVISIWLLLHNFVFLIRRLNFMHQLFYIVNLVCITFMDFICMEWTGVVNYMFIITRFSAADLSLFLSDIHFSLCLMLYSCLKCIISSCKSFLLIHVLTIHQMQTACFYAAAAAMIVCVCRGFNQVFST
jgi:hypothetical protein